MKFAARAFALIICTIILSPVAHAHVKWFTPESYDAARAYQITDWPVLLWIALGVAIIYIGVLIERHGPKIHGRFAHTLHKCEVYALSLFSIVTGLGLLYYATHGYLFAPNLVPTDVPAIVFLSLEGIIGALLVLGIFVRSAGIALLSLYAMLIYEFGVFEMADALEIIGIGIFLILVGRPRLRISRWKRIDDWSRRYRDYAIPVLRVFTGLNLIVLGLSEKILAPGLALGFLEDYDWNFMQTLGFEWFADYWFVLSAGAVEILLGVVFVLGIVTRINTLVLLTFFFLTLLLLGPAEVIGHLLHFAIATILLVYGSGRKWKFV